MHNFKVRMTKFKSNLWYFHAVVPDDIAKYFKEQSKGRVMCTINDSTPFHCAIMPGGEGGAFINLNKEIRSELKIDTGDLLEIHLEEDKSKYGMFVCEEFEELLLQDPEGETTFHALTPGKQRNLIYIANKPKTSDTRLRYSIRILEHLRLNNGKIDFKVLNQAIRQPL